MSQNRRKYTQKSSEVGSMEQREKMKEYLNMFLRTKLNIFLNNHLSVLEFPKYEKPTVSIILVLYNKAEFTYQCLETVKAHADVPYELIIVDNASNEETVDLLKKVKNCKVLVNKENKGFLKACNQAVEVAQGDWLLFLNNDTQITPCLLSTLLQTGQKIQKCGAVGGKLIFPDGKLQEAGSIIWNQGSCLGYGREENPLNAEYSYLKEVDFCSGACLFVKREIFQEAGMFNEIYSPAYYEETDLCMKIRELGYKVMFQPEAVVIHYEFGSSSSMDAAIKLQVKNRDIFSKRWKRELHKFYPPAIQNSIFAREHRAREKQRILVVDDRIPVPELGSGFPRSSAVLEGLVAAGFQVTFFPLQIPQKVQPYTYNLQQKGVEVFFNDIPEKLDFQRFYESRKDYYHLVWISRPHNMEEIADVIQNANPNQRIIYDAEALYSAREVLQLELNGYKLSQEEKKSMIESEIELMHKADIVVTVSEAERKMIKNAGFHNVQVLGHCVAAEETEKSFKQRKDILFVGGFLTSPSPNEDAILYFAKEIFPEVHLQTGAKLWIVGTNFLESVKRLASEKIIVTDRVDDLRHYYNQSRVFVVPTRYAAGISLKLLESFAHGVPAVVTPLIAKQLGFKEDVALVGKNSSDFIKKVVACYSDSKVWERLRNSGLNYVESNFDAKLFHRRLLKLVKP